MSTTKTAEARTAHSCGHTPGPLEVGPSSNPKNGSGWRDIVSTGTEFNPCYVGEALEQDAIRIVACWNACDGISDPADLRRQRDELLEALKRALSAKTGDWHRGCGWDRIARAVIAKAEGRAE